MERDWFFWTY